MCLSKGFPDKRLRLDEKLLKQGNWIVVDLMKSPLVIRRADEVELRLKRSCGDGGRRSPESVAVKSYMAIKCKFEAL